MRTFGAIVALLLFVPMSTSTAPAARAATEDDFDPSNAAWNGTSRLVALAAEIGVPLVVRETLDWSDLQVRDGILILHPLGEPPAADLVAFVRAGGRLAVADDFGNSSRLLGAFGILRSTRWAAAGPSVERLYGNPELPVAVARREHPLTVGVERIYLNHPAAFVAPLPPIFELGQAAWGLASEQAVVAGIADAGRIVAISDASVLINNMLEFDANRRFAENLLRYLATVPASRVVLVHDAFETRGRFGGGGAGGGGGVRRALQEVDEFFPAFNGFLRRIGGARVGPVLLRAMAAVAAVLALLAAILVLPFGAPSPHETIARLSSRTPSTGFVGRMRRYAAGRADDYLLPALMYRWDFQMRLLESLDLRAPAPLERVLDRYRARAAGAGQRSTARYSRRLAKLLDRLERIAIAADQPPEPPRVAGRRLKAMLLTGESLIAILGKGA